VDKRTRSASSFEFSFPNSTLSDTFSHIITSAKTIAKSTMVQTEAEMLNEAIRSAMTDIVKPLFGKLDQLDQTITDQTINTIDDLRRLGMGYSHGLAIRPPANFSGHIGECFSSWIAKLLQVLLLQGIKRTDQEIKVIYLESNLAGPALAASNNLKRLPPPNKPTNFDEFVTELKKFIPRRPRF